MLLLPYHQGTPCSLLSCSDFLTPSSFQLPVPNPDLADQVPTPDALLWPLDPGVYRALSAQPLLRKDPCSALVTTMGKSAAPSDSQLVPTLASASHSEQGNSCSSSMASFDPPLVGQRLIFRSVVIMACLCFQRRSKNGIMGCVWVEGPSGKELRRQLFWIMDYCFYLCLPEVLPHSQTPFTEPRVQ